MPRMGTMPLHLGKNREALAARRTRMLVRNENPVAQGTLYRMTDFLLADVLIGAWPHAVGGLPIDT